MASGPSSRRASAGAMSSQPMWTALALNCERHVHPVVDDERHAAKRRLDRARALDHEARIAKLVAKLAPASRRRPPASGKGQAVRGHPPPPDRDNGVAAKIRAHQLTFARAMTASRSSA